MMRGKSKGVHITGRTIDVTRKAAERRSILCSGFSLVEVALALGIIVVALVALVGLLSTGIQVGRTAKSDLIAAQVASTILAERRAAPTATLAANPLPSLTNSTGGLVAVQLDQSGKITSSNAFFTLLYEVEPVSPRLSRAYLALSHPAQSGSNYASLGRAVETYETTSYIRID